MSTPNMNTALSAIFDVELAQTDRPLAELQIEAKKADTNNLEKQRDYVRGNMVELIEHGKEMMRRMTEIATSTEAGKDFEVANHILKTLVDTNAKLLECEVAGKAPEEKTKPVAEGNSGVINNTAVFVGSTADLGKMIRNGAIDVGNSQQ